MSRSDEVNKYVEDQTVALKWEFCGHPYVDPTAPEFADVARQLEAKEASGDVPWAHPDLAGWTVVSMSIREGRRRRHMAVTLTNGHVCIKAEGSDSQEIWEDLRADAVDVAKAAT